MASMNFRRAAAIATMVTSTVLMGGAAFAAPATPQAGDRGQTMGLVPEPVSKIHEAARNAEADTDRQIGELRQSF